MEKEKSTFRSDEKFTIIIDFDKEAKRPSRIFQSMADLINAFEALDHALVKSIDNKIETLLVLEDVEKGSLKTIVRNVLKGIPDSAIEDLDLKKVIGHYLVKVKYIILRSTENKISLTDGKVVEDIEYELIKEAKDTGVDRLPYYVPVTKKLITSSLIEITESLNNLDKKDSVIFDSSAGRATFNLDINLNIEELEELITTENLVSTTKMILKVKKPDYLGDSQWNFKHGEHPINAKIEDSKWLKDFQEGNIELRPQDSLTCMVEVAVKYDENSEVISTTHIIKKVIKVHNKGKLNDNQNKLDF